MAGPRLILASASERRRDLLRQLGLDPITQASHVDEGDVTGPARERVLELARRKAAAVAAGVWSGWIIGADTLGALDDQVLGQPADAADARRMLRALSGRAHEVVTAVVVLRCEDGLVVDRAEDIAATTVRFTRLPDATIDAYIATGEPMGKAGAYAIQGRGAAFVERIDGSWANVVGLPVQNLIRLLCRLDFPLPPHLHLEP